MILGFSSSSQYPKGWAGTLEGVTLSPMLKTKVFKDTLICSGRSLRELGDRAARARQLKHSSGPLTGMSMTIAHFAVGAMTTALLCRFVAPRLLHSPTVLVAGGVWAVVPDVQPGVIRWMI